MSVLQAKTSVANDTPATAMFAAYTGRLSQVLEGFDWSVVAELGDDMLDAWKTGRQVFFCGNGGSAGNAAHLANDFIYGVGKTPGSGLRAHALSANASVLTCLANDEGYDKIYSLQLGVLARPDDILIVLSGSGNSPNILRALEESARIGMKSYAMLGYSGGAAKDLADRSIHFAIDDMQISEDTQLIIGHMLMQYLWSKRHEAISAAT
jgi:D-sedoheptulose 7-phosphate isomerase